MKSAGLYIHIPFCVQKCAYCDFVSFAGREDAMEPYADALLREMEAWKGRYPDILIPTVYLGGGTPSALRHGLVAKIMSGMREMFAVDPVAEITLEANPGTLDEKKLEEYLEAGVNRLSVGLQSANGALLRVLGRAHGAADFVAAAGMARRAGFINISADVMYGLPGQTVRDYLDAVQMACDSGAKHISGYALTLEEGTLLYESVRAGLLELPEEDVQYAMFEDGKRLLEALGYKRYEISNYAVAGYESRHNLMYWENKPYLGLGAGAHSAIETENGTQRLANTDDLDAYIKQVLCGQSPVNEKNGIDAGESMFETMMLGLRLVDGIDLNAFSERYQKEATQVFKKQIDDLMRADMLFFEKGRLKPTSLGLDFHSRVALEFLAN